MYGNSDCLAILEGGVSAWNLWREQNPELSPDLRKADFRLEDLGGVNFRRVDLRGANLFGANLENADLSGADIRRCNLELVRLENCILPEPKHIAVLNAGIPRWNEWRKENRDADVGMHFADLEGHDLEGANFSGVELWAAKLDGCFLGDVVFDGADLRRASMRAITVSNTSFRNTVLDKVSLQGEDLQHCDFRGASLCEAQLAGANFAGADFSEAILVDANLSGANCLGANFKGALLRRANLESCDLRQAKALRIDANRVRDTQFSIRAKDMWSVLRRNYTGPMFVYFLLVLLVVLVPYVSRLAFWIGVNQFQGLARHELVLTLTDVIPLLDGDGEGVEGEQNLRQREGPVADALQQEITKLRRIEGAEEKRRQISNLARCLAPECEERTLISVLMRAREPSAFALSTVALIYYVLRWLVTWRTTALREEEERSGHGPAHKDYRWLYRLHVVVNVLVWIVSTMLILKLARLPMLPVYLPVR